MKDNYKTIAQQNLAQLYATLPQDLAARLCAVKMGDRFTFRAFGRPCVISPDGIQLGKKGISSVFEILISLYALNATPEICIPSPLRSFKELPGTAPYVGAFTTHTEGILVPHVKAIKGNRQSIIDTLGGSDAAQGVGGDFAMVVYPLPKIALCYIFHEADEDFPASVTCLFSANAQQFLPVDALADVGEYTSRTILEIVQS